MPHHADASEAKAGRAWDMTALIKARVAGIRQNHIKPLLENCFTDKVRLKTAFSARLSHVHEAI